MPTLHRVLSDEFIARNDGYWRALEINFHYETKARKVMVDFKFDDLAIQVSLHREPPEVGLLKKLFGSLYWWMEQCVPTLVWRCRPFPIFRGRGKGLAHSHRRSRSGLHPI